MNRNFLEELGLEKEVIEQVMAEYGKAIQSVKPDDYDDLRNEKATLEEELSKLQQTLSSKEEEFSTYESKLSELEQEAEKYKLKDLKTTVAVQAGIPLELANRLSGTNEDELKADAEKIAGFVNKKQPLPLKPTEPNEVDSEEQAYANMAQNLLKGE